MDIHELLGPQVNLDHVCKFLDELHHEGRVAACRSLSGKEQARLFDAAAGFRKITVDDIVPPSVAPLVPVPHWGHNSMPAFKTFQKVFCRPDIVTAREAGELWGYNRTAFGLLGTVVGPGYYTAYDIPGGEVLVDYTAVPPHGAPGWPNVLPNSARLSHFVYKETQDTLRGISKHVTIGRAAKAGGDWMSNWFVLCRLDRW